ncbi:hypothetical protein TrVGV298_005454 [Trichoderma virens]|nr:hypothetical protein TrVGV298_005454 [Trichoderma virens]
MTLDTPQQQRFGPVMNFDYPPHAQSPAFSNPWSSSPSAPHTAAVAGNSLYVGPPQPSLTHSLITKPLTARPPTTSAPPLPSYAPMPVATTSADLLSLNRLQTSSAAYADATYATTASPVHGHFAPPSAAPYDTMGYAPAPVRPSAFSSIGHESDASRRFSQHVHADDRRGFAEALDASHGMLAMSQETPRNIYGNRNDRSSVDSYGFPSTHSTSSSISSSGNFSSYYGDSVSDYSTAGSDIESVGSRTLPRPQGMLSTSLPPCASVHDGPVQLQGLIQHPEEAQVQATQVKSLSPAKSRVVGATSLLSPTCDATEKSTEAMLDPRLAQKTTIQTKPPLLIFFRLYQ